jgi:YgiT-type zinc finger domain-containing protein
MKSRKDGPQGPAPVVTERQLTELKTRIAAAGHEPVFPKGTLSACPNCGGRMLTTNDLEETVATPGLVYIVSRLPGARCVDCGSVELDAAGVAILESATPRGIWADYETTVTHSSGSTLGTYFKMDLVRVLGLAGSERLFWKVLDRDKALVSIERPSGPRPASLMIRTGRAPSGPKQAPTRRRRNRAQSVSR